MDRVRMTATAPVDLAHLARYTGGDSAVNREILELFVRQSSALVAQLAAARDAKAWHDIAHSLKGAARGIGAFALADIAAEAEPLDPATQRARTEALLPRLKAATQAVHTFIETCFAP
jgi:HPt (histidine-containing phosphotransfer) domain-containing protein